MSIEGTDEEGEIGDGKHPALFHRQADLSVLPLLSQLQSAGKENSLKAGIAAPEDSVIRHRHSTAPP